MTADDSAQKAKKPSEIVAYWLDEIKSAKKREKDYRKDGERILEIYGGEVAIAVGSVPSPAPPA